jgi:hypothetical protein
MSNSREKLPELSVVIRVSGSTVWPLFTSVIVKVSVAFGSMPRPATSTWSQTGHAIVSTSAPDAGTAHKSRRAAGISDRKNRIGPPRLQSAGTGAPRGEGSASGDR